LYWRNAGQSEAKNADKPQWTILRIFAQNGLMQQSQHEHAYRRCLHDHAKLELYRRGQSLGQATGFFTEWNGRTFLITNWHVVSGLHLDTHKPLLRNGGIPDRVKFRVPVKGDIGQWLSPIEQLLYEDSDTNEAPEKPLWFEHQVYRGLERPGYGRRLDVVALPIQIPEDGAVRKIDAVNTVPKMRLKVAMDVFVLGYPKGIEAAVNSRFGREEVSQLSRVFIVAAPRTCSSTRRHAKECLEHQLIAIADGDFEVEGPPPAIDRQEGCIGS
jgi:hypothetical protein